MAESSTIPTEMSKAAQDIVAERRRQVEAEGWTPEHDDTHSHGEMAFAAAAYTLHAAATFRPYTVPGVWPWDRSWWKPSEGDRRRDLVKAGALILAEIERLDRSALAAGGER